MIKLSELNSLQSNYFYSNLNGWIKFPCISVLFGDLVEEVLKSSSFKFVS